MADRLYIVDGTAFVFRSYFAIKNLRDSSGRPTNAVFGFARVLLKLLREEEPTYIAMTFDAPGKTFRDDIYPEYKANRDKTPDDLISQFALIDTLVEAFDIPVLRIPGVEADDVMGTLARQAEAEGLEAVLVTGDKDLLQLVTDKTKVYDPNKGDDGIWYDPAGVKERYGVEPNHVIDILGLMGDTADNVPGVRGIGEKTAIKLLEKYGTMEGLYGHVDELKGKQKEKVIADKDMAFLSKTLVTIDTSIPLDATLESFRTKPLDNEKLAAVFADLEFQKLFEEFSPDSEPADLDYRLILTREELDAVAASIRKSGAVAVDTETTSVQAMGARLVGISLSFAPNSGFYIPVSHQPEAMYIDDLPVTGLEVDEAFEALRPVLEDPSIGKIGHNLKYDFEIFAQAGLDLGGIADDSMLLSYLTDPSRMRHNLNEVSLQYLRRKPIPISQLIGTGSKAVTFDFVPIQEACEYACEDADIAWQLAEAFQPVLKERELDRLYEEVELPLLHVLARMEMAGVAIDRGIFEGLRQEIQSRLEALKTEIFELAGEPFTINSPKQLQKILFEYLGLKPTKKTKTGYSTDVEVLEQLSRDHPLPEKVLEYRTLEKLRGTYVEALPKMVNPVTDRIHTSFNQAVAATGRLSSSDPNLQNIPIRTGLGRRIREGFVSGCPENRLIAADYSQIELRVLAHLSGDVRLQEAFRNDEDIHRETAARVFGVEHSDVTADMRRQAKAVNFGVLYGQSAFGLAKSIGVSNKEAGAFIEQYFAQYPGVHDWMERTKEEARERGYVTTLLNRRRYLPALTGSDTMAQRAAERIAINTPVQGTAADIIKIAMIRLDKALAGTESRMVLQVHDELIVEAPAGESDETATTMREVMESALKLEVTLKVDMGIGLNWAEIH
jgi:DNA polymerase-1